MDRWQDLFSKAAFHMRWLAVAMSLGVLVLTLIFVDCGRYNTWLTAFEALLGIAALWITLEIFRIGFEISRQQNQLSADQGRLIQEVHSTVMVSLRVSHAQELRQRYEESKKSEDEQIKKYWHFAWRFETYSILSIGLKPKGWAKIRIVGTNNPPLETNLERLKMPIYTVDAFEVQDNVELKEGRAYCWYLNGKLQISNDANEIELYSPRVDFEIIGLGNPSAKAV